MKVKLLVVVENYVERRSELRFKALRTLFMHKRQEKNSVWGSCLIVVIAFCQLCEFVRCFCKPGELMLCTFYICAVQEKRDTQTNFCFLLVALKLLANNVLLSKLDIYSKLIRRSKDANT